MGRRSTGTVEPLKTSIRLKFTHLGARRIEALDLAPTPPNLRAAERLMARIQQAISAGVYRREDFFDSPGRAAPTHTFRDYAAEWIGTKVLAKSTRDSYDVALSASWNPLLGDLPISQIRYSDVAKAVSARSKAVSGKTVNNHLIVLRGVFDMAMRDGLIAKDPTEGVENLRHQSPDPDPFDPDERDAILAHMRRGDEQVWNYFLFAFWTGLRPSEQIVLGWPDIDWKRRKAKISKARVSLVEKGTKTNTVREIDLNDAVMAALERQKVHTFMKRPDGPIFENPATGDPWNDLQVQRRRYFTPALVKLKIRHRDMYQTRHTFATALLMGGINPTYISKQLGHANTGMLFKVYTRWIEGADRGAEAAKANALLGQSSTNCPDEEAQR